MYALKITGINTNNFSEIVNLFNLYFAIHNLNGVKFYYLFEKECIYVTFPGDYNFANQMVLIGNIGIANAAKYSIFTGLPNTTFIYEDLIVNLTSEVFRGDNNTNKVYARITPNSQASISRFVDYSDVKSSTKLILNDYISMINKNTYILRINKSEMLNIRNIVHRYKYCRKIAKTYNKVSQKQKHQSKKLVCDYFHFIINTTLCFYSKSFFIKQYENACKQSINPFNMFNNMLADINICLRSNIFISIIKLFDKVIGYNLLYNIDKMLKNFYQKIFSITLKTQGILAVL